MSEVGLWLRRAALGLLLAVLLLATLTGRMVIEGEAALRTSDAAFDRDDLAEAMLHARRVAILYAPGAPHVAAAFARLRAIALGAEALGDINMARRAWGAVRGAALETRHLTVPHQAELDLVNQNLARLRAGGPTERQTLLKQLE